MSSDHDDYMEIDDGNESEIVVNASGPPADPSALPTDSDTSKSKWAWNKTGFEEAAGYISNASRAKRRHLTRP